MLKPPLFLLATIPFIIPISILLTVTIGLHVVNATTMKTSTTNTVTVAIGLTYCYYVSALLFLLWLSARFLAKLSPAGLWLRVQDLFLPAPLNPEP